MKPRRRSRRLLLVSFVIIVPLAFLAARSLESEASVRARVGSILATLVWDCSQTCTWNCDTSGYHEVEDEGVGAERPVHECGYNSGGCTWHEERCGEPGRRGTAELQKLIPSLDGDGIRYLAESIEAFTLNLDRRAVQVLGCGGDVVLSVNLTPVQESQLAIDN